MSVRNTYTKISNLLGEIEDCEMQALKLGLTEVALSLRQAKLDALAFYTEAEARHARVRAGRAELLHSSVIAFPRRAAASQTDSARI